MRYFPGVSVQRLGNVLRGQHGEPQSEPQGECFGPRNGFRDSCNRLSGRTGVAATTGESDFLPLRVDSLPWRAFIENTNPAPRLLFEGTVIVLSILLAFGIDRGYEAWRDRGEEQVVLMGLLEDFRANEESLGSYVQHAEVLRESSAAFVAYAVSDQAVRLDSLTTLGRPLFRGGTFDPQSATLDQVEASGRADLISDDSLRRLIAEWRTHVEDAVHQQGVLAEWQADQVWPPLMDLGIGPGTDMEMGRDLAPNWPPSDRAVAARGSALEQRIRALSGLARITRDDLTQALNATSAVIERLELLTN